MEDVASAMRDEDELHDKLRAAHKEVMALVAGVARTANVKDDVKAVIAHLGTEDAWFVFRRAADGFLKAYGTLAPDPRILPYQGDLKFVAAVLPYGRLHFEKVEETDWKQYSEKIRAMLDAHLEVTGLKTVCKLRSLSDAGFWGDFGEVEDLATAAVRKLAELKKETSERVGKNAAMYERFSDRVKELIKAFSAGLIDAAEVLIETEALAKAVLAADEAHVDSGLNKRAFGIAAILVKFSGHVAAVAEVGAVYGGEGHDNGDSSDSNDSNGDSGGQDGGAALEALHQAAAEIDAIYASDVEAPAYWQDKPTLKKELRGQVRRLIQKLGLTGWQSEVPKAVEDYALRHYGKP